MKLTTGIFILLLLMSNTALAEITEYNLSIKYHAVNFTGRVVQAMSINGSIPGLTLRFTVGDTARIHVRNEMDVETSIHWHGILLPNLQDGVYLKKKG